MNFKEKFLTYGKIDDCPIIDIHAHGRKFYGAALPMTKIEDALEYFKYCNVKRLAIVTHTAQHSPQFSNDDTFEWANKYDIFKVWISANPHYMDVFYKDIEKYFDLDCVLGLKTLGDYYKLPLSNDKFKPIFEFANEKGCGFLLHTWGEGEMNNAREVEYVLKNYPNIKVVAGHSIHVQYDLANKFAKDYKNFYMDIVAIPDEREVIEKYMYDVIDKVLFGTDWPWFSYHYYIGALLDTGLDEESIRKICYKNAEKLFPVLK